ncbi:PP2C family protein-serine/threonine phosphatase [Streptomyces rochei]|uniref:PP2C family protein-serine/threonine phosphatase n=2 Tax=Streptomyces rochei group TaxID=2867164 RepID=A0ABW7ED67_STRRO|nr:MULTISPECIES: GAF domain-containing SpoIIE family protein phosphatase [Streptomyces]MDI3100946.1 SpoIIE family protein phosphatase [Streptomyces sp. AN-3]QCB26569.1 GAF domain-containing protein [Streptomyces sp. SS52]UXI82706.1 SpoIIE family protein phosphatase [Streptomyces vinaceusdrappus]WDI22805.1 SpoIIE family protein phosphatase [Streptomyces enissocaesilis]
MTASSVQAGLTAPAAEEARLAAVRRYHILDTPPDGAFDRIASLAARLFDAPMATVAIVDTDRVWFKAAHGLDGISETDREPGLCASAILHGEPYVVTDADSDARAFANPLVRSDLGVRFYAAAPITTADGQRLGTVNVLDTRPRQPTDDQLEALKDLAALVMDELELRLSAIRTVAAERERRAEAERLARALQRTLLPPALPDVPGLQVAAAYHTASADEVGGDFYDLFPLDDGRWAFFLGDVCGKGADAAALTSLTRYTLRAAAIYDPDPCAALANLDAVLKGEYQGSDPRYCTAVFGVLQPMPDGSHSVTLAGGGHPSALALRADGSVQAISTAGGQLIGMLPSPQFVQTTARLFPGECLLLYTDGLTEARTSDGRMLDEDGLTRHLAATAPRTADQLLQSVEALLACLGEGVTDDTALLALSVPAPFASRIQENR